MRLTALLFSKKLATTALRATEQEIEIKAPWGKIAALAWGNPSNPPVFLCHGRLDSATSFRPLVDFLPQENFYVSVDLPGNGRSDHMPKGASYLIVDCMPTISTIREHFKWDKFVFVGHSLGAGISKYYNIIYPGQMTRIVELDPEPAYLPPYDGDIKKWYNMKFEPFYRNFHKYAAGLDTAPKYAYEDVRSLMMKARGIDENIADQILERCLVPTDDGKFRLTFDQRMKLSPQLPFTAERLKELYLSSSTPTLAILASKTVDRGWYKPFPFVTDPSAWPHGNYSYVIVEAGHDVHLHKTEEVARLIVDFLGKSSPQ